MGDVADQALALALEGDTVDWDALFTGFGAGVDWPIGGFWRELSAAYPEAIVLGGGTPVVLPTSAE